MASTDTIPTPKKRKSRKKKAAGGAAVAPVADMVAFGSTDDPASIPVFDADAQVLEIPNDDGTITINLAPQEEPKKPTKFDDNLAEVIDPTDLGRIAEDLLEAIEQDDRSRSEWLTQRADGLDLLGLKVEKPGTGNVGSSSTAVAGQSKVRDSILAEAVDLFQANSFAELCPSDGPCKGRVVGDETADNAQLAQELETDLNYYLTGSGPGTAKEYYPDTRKMLWWTGYASGMFKKVYPCPLRRRPVSESIDGADLIVPSNVTDLANAGRITHVISMRQSVMKRMQIIGVYRDVSLTEPTPQPNALQNKEANVTGINNRTERPADQDYTLYECYCELDIPGFEHKEKGEKEPSGLPLPYRVTIDKDSRQILEIRRNWRSDDEDMQAKIPFVAFPYTDNIGFYGTGLLHRLGNYTMALTAMLRECIDAGMFASFPGFLFAKPMGRQLQNEFRVPPGGGAPIDVSATGNDINKAVMPLPYKDVSTAMVALMAQTRENAFRYGSMANTGVAEGTPNAPVGTTLAMIEQATKIEGGVHKALHTAQAQELQLFKELFREDPDALWRGNKRPAMGKDAEARRKRFLAALDNCDIVPASDPNVPSNMHRIAKANALLQTAMATPGLFNLPAVIREWGVMMKIPNIEQFMAPPQPPQAPQPDPAIMAKLAIDKQNADTKQLDVMMRAQNAEKDRQSKEQIAAAGMALKAHNDQQSMMPDPGQAAAMELKARQLDQNDARLAFEAHNSHAERQSKETIKAMDIASRLATHPESQPIVNDQLADLSNYMQPAAGTPGAPTMAEGGVVDETDTPVTDLDTAELVAAIELALRYADLPKTSYPN